MKKNPRGAIFGFLFGSIFVGVGLFAIWDSHREVRSDAKATGTVVDVTTSVDKGRTRYSPVIEFKTPDGQSHRFTSRISSSFRPTEGDSISVFYNPQLPENALVNSAWNMYIGPGFFVFMGLLAIFLSSLLPIIISRRHDQKMKRLRAIGRPIQAQITGAVKTGLEVNRVPYYAITAQWLDQSNTLHVFKSFGMSYNPTTVLKNRKEVTVYVNPINPKDYWMDTTFLPENVE